MKHPELREPRHFHPAALPLPPCRLETSDGALVAFESSLGERVVTVQPKSGELRANVVWVHGLSDHSARQLDTARWLAGRGYRTLLFDTLGHGGRASERAASFWVAQHYLRHQEAETLERAIRDDPRFTQARNERLAREQFDRLSTTTFEQHAKQVEKIVNNVPRFVRDDRELPLFLVGHSMGALLAIETIWRLRGRRVRGAVLLSPALEPRGNPESLAQQLAIGAFWGLRRAPFSLTRGALKTLLRLNFAVDTTWGNRWVSDQPGEVRLFGTDPLIPDYLPAGYASSIESQMVRTDRRSAKFPVEGLVLVPGEDGITSRGAGIRFARRIAAAMGRDHFRLESLDGTRAHDLLRSTARDRVRSLLGNWLDERSTPAEKGRLERAA